MLWAVLFGFVAYGLSIFFYVRAQRMLGAAKTSAYYAVAPFIGAGLLLVVFGTLPGCLFLPALAVWPLEHTSLQRMENENRTGENGTFRACRRAGQPGRWQVKASGREKTEALSQITFRLYCDFTF